MNFRCEWNCITYITPALKSSASYTINIGLEPLCDAWFGHDNLNTICVEEKKRESFVSVTA